MYKVVIIGPESTGKSSLARSLAAHFNTGWVEEYAREYLLTNGKEYMYEDLYTIAIGQLALESKATADLTDKPLVFIDTDLHVIRVWSEFVFNRCDNRILQHIARRQYNLYLLCDTDLPWEADPLRELPDPKERRKIFHYYLDAMQQQPVPWALIHGPGEERLAGAMEAVDRLLV